MSHGYVVVTILAMGAAITGSLSRRWEAGMFWMVIAVALAALSFVVAIS